jgi:hypothetical protein
VRVGERIPAGTVTVVLTDLEASTRPADPAAALASTAIED